MLELKNFSVCFNGTPVLKKLNLQAAEKERLAVIGQNGSGKTTLALALAKVIPDFVQATVSGKMLCSSSGLVM